MAMVVLNPCGWEDGLSCESTGSLNKEADCVMNSTSVLNSLHPPFNICINFNVFNECLFPITLIGNQPALSCLSGSGMLKTRDVTWLSNVFLGTVVRTLHHMYFVPM